MVPFRWEKFFLWVGLVAVAAVGVGQSAAWVGSYFRPLGVFALVVGGVLGGMLVLFMRLLDLAHRSSVFLGVVLGTVVCVGSEHWGHYRQALRMHERAVAEWMAQTQGLAVLSAQMAEAIRQQLPPPPGSVWEYMERQVQQGRRIGPWRLQGVWVQVSWGVEALLTFLAALALVGATMQWPYCSQCESWYRAVRHGRLPPEELRRWAGGLHVPGFGSESAGVGGRYRLLECLGRCGPSRLELFWEDQEGQLHTWRDWLDPEQRQSVKQLLQTADKTQTASDQDTPPPRAGSFTPTASERIIPPPSDTPSHQASSEWGSSFGAEEAVEGRRRGVEENVRGTAGPQPPESRQSPEGGHSLEA